MKMSTYASVHPFNSHVFTPTIYDKKTDSDKGGRFNYWIIIMTGTIFFITLSWYNFLLVLYRYILGIQPDNGETPL